MQTSRTMRSVLVLATAAVVVSCASTSFRSTWKAPGAEPLNFKGKKVAALIVSAEEGVRYGAEDALAREITARGAVGVAAYTIVPKEVIQDKDKAKQFLEKAGVAGVVAMRVVGKEQEISQSPGTYRGGLYWGRPYYGSLWGPGYWGYGWGSVYSPGYLRTDTIVSVEMLVYSLAQDKLVWAAQSETTNPSAVRPFIQDLTAKAADELKEAGLIR